MSSDPYTLREEHVIRDKGMLFPCEYDYAKTGVEEGWLVLIHRFRDYRDIVVHTYYYLEK